MDAAFVREVLDYSPETGALVWRKTLSGRAKAGSVAGHKDKTCVRVRLNKRNHASHRLIWLWVTGAAPLGVIDHINGDPFDNRWENLRDVSHSMNSQNQRRAQKRSKSGLLGVAPAPDGRRWCAWIRASGKNKNLGYFVDPKEAHEAYLRAKRQLHAGCVT